MVVICVILPLLRNIIVPMGGSIVNLFDNGRSCDNFHEHSLMKNKDSMFSAHIERTRRENIITISVRWHKFLHRYIHCVIVSHTSLRGLHRPPDIAKYRAA